MKEFYRQTVKEVLDRVESSEAGLTSEQADHSREKLHRHLSLGFLVMWRVLQLS